MAFNLTIPAADQSNVPIDLSVGQTLFVLGANGTGKSSLLHRFAGLTRGNSRRISASRQTWFQSSGLEFSPSQKQQFEQQALNWDVQAQSRWMEQNAQIRSSLMLYDLIDAENVDARAIANALRGGDLEVAQRLASKTAPIAKINELLELSNIPIKISVVGGDRLMASKNGSAPYGAAELSDGERNALLVAAEVLTSRSGILLIIDEPERHLHRSIISPLLSHLFQFRDDCAFVVATHDLMLPMDNPDDRVVLVRSCSYSGSTIRNWIVDVIPANADIDEAIKLDIVGARRRIIFVEGGDSSLDNPLYSILFPQISVRPKGSSKDVERAVIGIRSSEASHWVRAWGVVDNDGRDVGTVEALKSNGIHALPVYSVESIYYHPSLISGVARRHAATIGEDGDANAEKAIDAAFTAAQPHFPRLAARAVEKTIRHQFLAKLPTFAQIEGRQPIGLSLDIASVVDAETAALSAAAQARDWLRVLTRCPVRETPALDAIARAVGLRDHRQYESAVLQLLREDEGALKNTRELFGDLVSDLGSE